MTLNSGDIHNNEVLHKGWRLNTSKNGRWNSYISYYSRGGKTKERKRSWWVRPWAREERGQAQGFADILIMELR